MPNNTSTERWYAFTDRAGLPLITDHPGVKARGLTGRQLRRSIARGELEREKPGLYPIVSESMLQAWFEASRVPASR